VEKIFDPSQFACQTLFVRVAVEKLQHLLICFDAIGKRIVAKKSALAVGILSVKIEISRAPTFGPFVSGLFGFPEELEKLQRKPGMLVEQTFLDGNGVIGRDDTGLAEIVGYHLAATIHK